MSADPLAPPADLVAARERVVQLLTDRYADDSITADEFETRLDALHRAATPAALDALARDLAPTTAAPTQPMPVGTRAVARPVAHPFEQRMLALMSSRQQRGRWVVPSRLVVRAVMSELVLDLREAQLPAECEIELRALMAAVRIIVPAGVAVDESVMPFMAAAHADAGLALQPRTPGAPRLRITGWACMAEVKVAGSDEGHRGD